MVLLIRTYLTLDHSLFLSHLAWLNDTDGLLEQCSVFIGMVDFLWQYGVILIRKFFGDFFFLVVYPI